MFNALNFYSLMRSILFTQNPEKAHNLSLKLLSKTYKLPIISSLYRANPRGLPTTLMGLSLKNPVGLAAGMDKNGEYIDALGSMGFGFIEIGTVTPKAQSGNPKPRLFRLPQAESLINRMGFNNHGMEVLLDNVKKSQWRYRGGILGINIGKNATTPIELATNDYLIGLRGVYPHADYVAINISSPNTKNLRTLQGADELSELLGTLHDERLILKEKHGRTVPLAVKIAPDLDDAQIDTIAQVVSRFSIDGIIATNTTLSRQLVNHLPNANQGGGLSGPVLHDMSLKVIRRLRESLGSEVAIIGVGGINNGAKALEKIQAGANAVQIYTGLIYHGPQLIKDCVDSLDTH